MELLKEVVPLASRIAVLWIPGITSHRRSWKILRAAAPGLGVTLLSLEIRRSSDIDRAFATMKKERPAGFLILGDALFNTHRKQIVKLSLKSRLPAIYTNVQWVAGGGLMSYGADFVDIYHRMGIYAGKILKGTEAGALPVEQPRKIDLVINLKTAKHLGLKIPPEILLQATKVIK
jgi:putative ABC transport system substrate-binding protein